MGWRSHSSGDAADEKITMTSTYYYYRRTRRCCCCRRYQPAAARGGSAASGDERFLLFFPSVDSTTKTLAAVGAVARAHPH